MTARRGFGRMSAWSTLVLSLLLARPVLLHAEPAVAAPLTQPAGEISGALVLVGGGALPDSVRDRFLELAGGKDARLVVIGPANPSTDGAGPATGVQFWKDQGIASVMHLQARNRAEADDAAFIKPLTQATGVWLLGGDQAQLAETYRGTAVDKELHKLLERGGVIGGTSAGAAILAPVILGGSGLSLLPGAVIDAHVLKRNRVNRLTAALAKHPGYFGLGIDEQTAVVVKGRQLNVLGNSYAVVCQSPSSRRPASVQVLKPGDQADLIALSRAAIARAAPAFPPEKPEPPKVDHGTLIIGGGGGMALAIWRRFIELAGGPESLIVVVPTAMEDPLPAEPSEVRALTKAGAKNIKLLHTRSRAEANKPAFRAPLKEAKGVWFSGGRQWRFVDAYQGTATERAFHDVLRRGGVIGGSSAGASIQSDYMPRGDPLGNLNIIAEGYERGFGFLKGVAIDQHFFARKRPKDMSDLMAVYPQLLGIGIDEGTVIVVQGSVMEVVGKSTVAVYDRRKPVVTGEKDYEELPAGTRYDLATRKQMVGR